jgi:hypothetical protein
MNFVYTMATKSQASNTVQHFAAFVLRQFEHRVRVFHTDNERSLGKDFKAWITRKGIALELSATYTPAQNGAAEHSGGVLTAKAGALCIHVNLPETLWPESVKAAAYLANRSPIKSLD